MRCPKCGHQPTLGRPRLLDDYKVRTLHSCGLSLGEIAKKLRVSKAAVQQSLRRTAIPAL